MGGTEKTRERLSVVDELLAYWTLEDADDTLEELEDALITADFGPTTALKASRPLPQARDVGRPEMRGETQCSLHLQIVDGIREEVLSGKLKTGEAIKTALKASIVDVLRSAKSSSDLQLTQSPGIVFVVGVNG